MKRICLVIISSVLFLIGCVEGTQTPTNTQAVHTQAGTLTVTPSIAPSLTSSATIVPPIPTHTPSIPPTEPPTQTPTPDPYWIYSMDYLSGRAYGGGNIEFVENLAQNSYFTRYLFRYPSDGLMIYGFLNVPVEDGPAGEGPYPVIIALHGYIDPAIYNTIDYTTGYADALARAGYIVLHPNLRGYPPSDEGDNLFRVGMALDVLNLIAILEKNDWAGTPLEDGLPTRLGLWGHSMGGGVSTRVMLIHPEVDAVVLYAAMSGDEKQNWEAILDWSDGTRGLEELSVPEKELERISPVYYFDQLTAEVSIHHGRADELVPLRWSVATCDQLSLMGKSVECWYYANMPHTFYGDGDQLFVTRMIQFYDRVLK